MGIEVVVVVGTVHCEPVRTRISSRAISPRKLPP